MESDKNLKQKFKWFNKVIKHGLVIQGIRNRLASIGLDIMPYYWVQEAVTEVPAPKIRDFEKGYYVEFLQIEDIQFIRNSINRLSSKSTDYYLREDQWCVGIKQKNHLAAFMLVQFGEIDFRSKKINLKEDEAYLTDMYTFDSFRGKNIAPFLRFSVYELLKKEGIHKKFSVTEYFNKSSKRFKQKLNSEHKSLHLSIKLFRKHIGHFKLKDLSTN